MDSANPEIKRDANAECFGGCPVCGKCERILNLRKSHWACCHAHKMTWNIGENLFSSWRDESEEDWRRNIATLTGYRMVEPIFPECLKATNTKRTTDSGDLDDIPF